MQEGEVISNNNSANSHLKIGDLAKQSGLTVRTIRYYEELGLIKPLERSQGGFRLFSQEDVRRLKLVHYLKCMELPLNSIKELFSIKEVARTKGQLANMILPNLDNLRKEIQSKIEKYEKIRQDLEISQSIVQQCQECDRLSFTDCLSQCDVMEWNGEYPLIVRLMN